MLHAKFPRYQRLLVLTQATAKVPKSTVSCLIWSQKHYKDLHDHFLKPHTSCRRGKRKPAGRRPRGLGWGGRWSGSGCLQPPWPQARLGRVASVCYLQPLQPPRLHDHNAFSLPLASVPGYRYLALSYTRGLVPYHCGIYRQYAGFGMHSNKRSILLRNIETFNHPSAAVWWRC